LSNIYLDGGIQQAASLKIAVFGATEHKNMGPRPVRIDELHDDKTRTLSKAWNTP